ncbi:MAG: GmrSD restriction endonuclease domain-containing protein [Brevinemataceae bacterium]
MNHSEKYNVSQLTLKNILGFIQANEISIPEIQRPFVWKTTQVRDLVDSLYKGYPTGYLIIWQNPDVKLKDETTASGKKIIIDGQQRITALMSAIEGLEVLDLHYTKKQIKIAFNPVAQDDEKIFDVLNPSISNSKHWIPDISVLFKSDFSSMKFIKEYCQANPHISDIEIERAIEKVRSMINIPFGLITLKQELNIAEVTEIFVRINSKGTRLNQSDFAMSKIASDEEFGGNLLRKGIEYFCRLFIEPAFEHDIKRDADFIAHETYNKIKWVKNFNEDIFSPDYGDILRISFMYKFNRGKLADLVSLLSGRDFVERTFKAEIIEQSFKDLQFGVHSVINEYNFSNFILYIKSAGFIDDKMIPSKMTIDFAYTLFLLLKEDKTIDKQQLSKYVQKWFVLSTLTNRYVGSPESQMDRDLRSIKEKGFIKFFENTELSELHDSFWQNTLPQRLESSSVNNPHFHVFIASQIHENATSLLSNNIDIRELISNNGEVHHIFPKKFLQDQGINDRTLYNQVANYTYIDSTINKSIRKKSPQEYFQLAMNQCDSKESLIGTIYDMEQLLQNLTDNCIPFDIHTMTEKDYPQFLTERRKLIAQKIKTYYYSL